MAKVWAGEGEQQCIADRAAPRAKPVGTRDQDAEDIEMQRVFGTLPTAGRPSCARPVVPPAPVHQLPRQPDAAPQELEPMQPSGHEVHVPGESESDNDTDAGREILASGVPQEDPGASPGRKRQRRHRCPEEQGQQQAARHQDRREAWGPFSLSRVFATRGADLVQIGWGANCNLHSNSDDTAKSRCKKSLPYGHGKSALSDEQCRLHLKRWLVHGLDIPDTDPDARSTHLRIDARRACSAGLSEAELDARVGVQPEGLAASSSSATEKKKRILAPRPI